MANLIVIDITETEWIKLDSLGNLNKINGHGKITIKNPSNKSKLTDLNCDLKEIVNTTIDSKEINLDELNPSQEFNKSYQIQNLKKNSLIITELLNPPKEDNRCRLKITLRNPLKLAISDIRVSKELHDHFDNIKFESLNIGTTRIKTLAGIRILEWDIINLDAKSIAELLIHFNMEDSKRKNSIGSMHISYTINNYQLTRLNPEIRSNTNILCKISKQKSGEGFLDCKVEFSNTSEFQVKLENVKIVSQETTGVKTVASQTPNKVLNAGETWINLFQIKSQKSLELNAVVDYSPLFVVITHVNGNIEKESDI